MIRRKLVRDKIPEIIGMYGGHVSGQPVTFEQIPLEDLREALERKLQEEAAEFLLDPSTEELADILETCEALKSFYPDVNSVRRAKALQKGRFEEGWVMVLDEPPKDDED